MYTRRSLSEDKKRDEPLGFKGISKFPTLNLSQAKATISRKSGIQSARSHRGCLQDLDARASPAVTSARDTRPEAGKSRCGTSLVPSWHAQSNEMSALPGGLLMSRQGKVPSVGNYSNDLFDSCSLEKAMCPLSESLGWSSPLASARLCRVERMGRRRKPAHMMRQIPSAEDLGEPEKKTTIIDSVEKRLDDTTGIAKGIPPVMAFARLQTKALARVDNPSSSAALAANACDLLPRCPGGVFSPDIFSHYDVDHNGRLSVGELGALLRNHGMCIDYVGACRMMELIVGANAQSVDRKEFMRGIVRLVQKRRGTAGEAVEVLQCVFKSYDLDKSGFLDAQEYTRLLSDLGHEPKTQQNWEDQNLLISSCRKDGFSGPLDFQEFVVLLRKIHRGRGVDGWCV